MYIECWTWYSSVVESEIIKWDGWHSASHIEGEGYKYKPQGTCQRDSQPSQNKFSRLIKLPRVTSVMSISSSMRMMLNQMHSRPSCMWAKFMAHLVTGAQCWANVGGTWGGYWDGVVTSWSIPLCKRFICFVLQGITLFTKPAKPIVIGQWWRGCGWRLRSSSINLGSGPLLHMERVLVPLWKWPMLMLTFNLIHIHIR